MKKAQNLLVILLLMQSITSCSPKKIEEKPFTTLVPQEIDRPLTSITIIDRNGFTETLSVKERLKKYEKLHFLSPQPYQKVLRLFVKDKNGVAYSLITSYHPNGHIKQYLEVANGRAHGNYFEWYPNGKMKLQALVIEGIADIDEKSLLSWNFHGVSKAWDEDGNLSAEILYVKGELEGLSNYYNNNRLVKQIPYSKGVIHGTLIEWYQDGLLRKEENFSMGIREGVAKGFWPTGKLAFEEVYKEDKLLTGLYLDIEGAQVGSINKGFGTKCFFDDFGPKEYHEYKDGIPEGSITVLKEGYIISVYFVKHGKKHGEELFYYPTISQETPPQKKLSINWKEGKISGLVKSWYSNGIQESQRELSQNFKQGLFTAWYDDGSLMFIEEYEKDKLIKGEYLKRSETIPISKVILGNGKATLFDSSGSFLKSIEYLDGHPIADN